TSTRSPITARPSPPRPSSSWPASPPASLPIELRSVLGGVGSVGSVGSVGVGGLAASSAIDVALKVLGVAVAVNGNLGRRSLQFAQILRRKHERGRGQVFLEARQLGGAGNGHDPGLLRQQPSQRDLGLGGPALIGESSENADQCLVGGAVFGCEP